MIGRLLRRASTPALERALAGFGVLGLLLSGLGLMWLMTWLGLPIAIGLIIGAALVWLLDRFGVRVADELTGRSL